MGLLRSLHASVCVSLCLHMCSVCVYVRDMYVCLHLSLASITSITLLWLENCLLCADEANEAIKAKGWNLLIMAMQIH